jgi:hypothetical protein
VAAVLDGGRAPASGCEHRPRVLAQRDGAAAAATAAAAAGRGAGVQEVDGAVGATGDDEVSALARVGEGRDRRAAPALQHRRAPAAAAAAAAAATEIVFYRGHVRIYMT